MFIFCLEYKWRELTSSSQIILFHMFLEVDITGEILTVRMHDIENYPDIPNSKQVWLSINVVAIFDVTYPAEPPCKMLVILVNGGTRFYVQRNVLRICPFLTTGMSPDLVPGKSILPRSGLSLGTTGEFTVSLPWYFAIMSRFNRVEIAEGLSLVDLLSEWGLWYKKLIS